jgi:hypothetical protein
MFSKTSFRRRRYRFKEGSTSSIKKAASKQRRKDTRTSDVRTTSSVPVYCSPIQEVTTPSPVSVCSGSSPSDFPRLSTTEPSPPCLRYDSLTDPVIFADKEISEIFSQTTDFVLDQSQPFVDSTISALDDLLSDIPSFDDCLDDLYNSFQTDYYNTL